MFFKKNNALIQLEAIYTENFTQANKTVFAQVSSHTLHTLSLVVKQDKATLKVDGLNSSYSKFFFPKPSHGAFSLVSNNKNQNQGGYRSVRLTSNGNILLDIDFSKLSSVLELEDIFDCYYIESLTSDVLAQRVAISDYWSLSDLGYLVCNQYTYNVYSPFDASNFCMLTLRSQILDDFELNMEFAQSWNRYGVVFGCEPGRFPYFYYPESQTYTPLNGAFAYIEAEGYRTMRGNLLSSAFNSTPASIIRYDTPLSSFSSATNEKISSANKPMLIYHIDSDGQYVCDNTSIPLGAGHLTYLPPRTKYLPSYTHDKRIIIEFNFLKEECNQPDFIIPLHPEKIQILFEKMLLLRSDLRTKDFYKSHSIFYQILAESQNTILQNSNIPEIIYPSFCYMNKYFSTPRLTIAEVAHASNISEVYFRQVFKKATGQLPNKYILNLRIKHAIFLLQNSNYKVNEIAAKSGFSDIKYFMTAFKKITGFSPQKYRNLLN